MTAAATAARDHLDDPGWGPVVRWRRTPAELELRRLEDEHFIAVDAQLRRAERVTLAYAEEHARYFGLGEHAGGGAEQLLTPHGTAGGYQRCREGEASSRCPLCRAWQAARVRRNRSARAGFCARNRSSYDAGCRCTPCRDENAAGCRRWRERTA